MANDRIVFQTEENTSDIADLKKKLCGDNGNKGLIRRVDMIEQKLNVLTRISWTVLTLILGLLVNSIYTQLIMK
ncbi:MAG: hypothetical protein ACE5IR_27315 [bacterium]